MTDREFERLNNATKEILQLVVRTQETMLALVSIVEKMANKITDEKMRHEVLARLSEIKGEEK